MPELQRALLFIMKRLLLPDEIKPRRSSNRHQKNGPAITLPPDIAQRSSTVTFDGCQVGFVDGDGKPMKKPFKIMTNINELVNLLETKVCPRNHKHTRIMGIAPGDTEQRSKTVSYTHLRAHET